MNTIAARELRNHTADVLRRVQAGEVLEVLQNNQPVAKIVPLHGKRTWIPGREVASALERLGPETTGWSKELRQTLTETTDDLPW